MLLTINARALYSQRPFYRPQNNRLSVNLDASLPLDDVYIALKEKIPNLTRSNLHRCLKRNGLNVLPKEEESSPEKKKFKEYPIGFVHIDITEVRTDQGKCGLFVAIDRATKYVYVELHSKMSVNESSAFLKNLIAHCPFKITKILTDNRAQFTYELLAEHLRPKNKTHPFDLICKEHNIEHRLTKFKHQLDQWSDRSHQQNPQTIHNKGLFLQRHR